MNWAEGDSFEHWLVMYSQILILDIFSSKKVTDCSFKKDFLNIFIFLHSQIPYFQIVISLPNIVLSYLFRFQLMYKSKLKKITFTLMTGFVVHGHIFGQNPIF